MFTVVSWFRPAFGLAAFFAFSVTEVAWGQATLHPANELDSAPGYTVWRQGAAEDTVPTEATAPRAGLLLMGGGGDVEAAWRWFVACAGGGDLVVLRAGGGDGYQDYLYREIGGLASVTTLRFDAPAAAHDPEVLAQLARAEAIFLAGGDQAKYIAYWKNTPVAAALQAHLAAGKPLGGSSAGLAVLGEFYFSAEHDTITSAEAMADPHELRVTLGDGFLAAPALRSVLTDSHFSERERAGRLVAFLARLQVDRPDRPRLVGIGIDEATALCIEPDGEGRVLGRGQAWLLHLNGRAHVITPGQPLSAHAMIVGLGAESRIDFNTFAVTAPTSLRALRIVEGRLLPADPAPRAAPAPAPAPGGQ
jgi:cyanophycinase